MDTVSFIVTIGCTVVASTGFWMFVDKITTRKSATTQLLLGLAHDRIIFLGMGYIRKGWITNDEYDDFLKYLYEPYAKFGGNGLADSIMNRVNNLPFKDTETVFQKKDPNETH